MRRALLDAYAPVAMAIGLGALALLCLLWWPLALAAGALPLPGRWRRAVGRRVIHSGMAAYLTLLRLLCIVRIDNGELSQLRGERRLVVVANHPSLLDAVILMASLPNAVCVMKAALLRNPMYGAAARLAHYVSNANAWTVVNEASAELGRDEGAQLVIFPEGTRTTSFPANTCSPAGALIAQRSRVPLQAVLIDMSTPYLGKKWPLFRPPVLPLRIRVRLGPRYDVVGDARRTTELIERAFGRRGSA